MGRQCRSALMGTKAREKRKKKRGTRLDQSCVLFFQTLDPLLAVARACLCPEEGDPLECCLCAVVHGCLAAVVLLLLRQGERKKRMRERREEDSHHIIVWRFDMGTEEFEDETPAYSLDEDLDTGFGKGDGVSGKMSVMSVEGPPSNLTILRRRKCRDLNLSLDLQRQTLFLLQFFHPSRGGYRAVFLFFASMILFGSYFSYDSISALSPQLGSSFHPLFSVLILTPCRSLSEKLTPLSRSFRRRDKALVLRL